MGETIKTKKILAGKNKGKRSFGRSKHGNE
jgi:hypothetical protein